MKKLSLCHTFLAAMLCISLFFSCSSDNELSNSNSSEPSSSSIVVTNGTFTDTRDGKIYGWVRICEQVWMMENLSYNIRGKCYGESGYVALQLDDGTIYDLTTITNTQIQNNCDKYGRLYDWVTALALPSSCNSNSCNSQISTNHQGICPSGWHIPSNAEWAKLYHCVDGTDYVEGISGTQYASQTADKYLKATSGWSSNGNGMDTYGFTALPGGFGVLDDDGYFYLTVGKFARWHSSSEANAAKTFFWGMDHDTEGASYGTFPKKPNYLCSVRCVQN